MAFHHPYATALSLCIYIHTYTCRRKNMNIKSNYITMDIRWNALIILLPLLFVSPSDSTAVSGKHAGAGLIAAFDNPAFVEGTAKPSENQQASAVNMTILTDPKVENKETTFLGEWKVENENVGVAAMQLQLMPTGKAVWYDTTSLGPSGVKNNPAFCRKKVDNSEDCYAHAIEYDVQTATYRTLKMLYDPWCTCGGLGPTGDLISFGGSQFNNEPDARKSIRLLANAANSEFNETLTALADNRWYSSSQELEDGNFIVVGGRDTFSYEIVPPGQLSFPQKKFDLPFLKETLTPPNLENNLYPFLHLLPDGNVFLFANSKSIILEPKTGKIVRNLPELPGGSRNYPASGMSALLPLDLSAKTVHAEVIVCGGSPSDALKFAEHTNPRKFLPALNDCNRLVVTNPNAKWEKEEMPSPRVMGDLLILPNGQLLMINGAKAGCSAWECAEEPNLTPVLYTPEKPKGQRMKELAPTNIARMYHSASTVLQNGQVLVAGSNPHQHYDFKAKYPTELRVERFSPPYLTPDFQKIRPTIAKANTRTLDIKYGDPFEEHIRLKVKTLEASEIKMTMYAPPFTTHGYSMNQRLVSLGLRKVSQDNIKAVAPSSPKVAPPGWYILYVVYHGVPSAGRWVHLHT